MSEIISISRYVHNSFISEYKNTMYSKANKTNDLVKKVGLNVLEILFSDIHGISIMADNQTDLLFLVETQCMTKKALFKEHIDAICKKFEIKEHDVLELEMYVIRMKAFFILKGEIIVDMRGEIEKKFNSTHSNKK